MLAARLGAAGEILRCYTCGAPGVIGVTDLPESLRKDSRATVVLCKAHAEEHTATVERLARAVDDMQMAADARDFVAAVREVLGEVV